VAAIRRIASGGAFVSPETAERLALDFERPVDALPHTLLSDREFQVFQMIVNGKSVSQIASDLALSVKTVSTHKTRIMGKMKLSNQAELVRYAVRHKLLDDSSDSSTV
jgi:two-component system, NarL family, invasion response regulator UvrY